MQKNFVRSVVAGALLASASLAAFADTATVTFVRLGGTTAQGTAIFRADLSGLSFSEIQSITLVDSNSGTGGSPGQYSGFDLDAIKLSTTLASTAAEASAAAGLDVFDFSPSGTFFTPGTQRAPAEAKLNGTSASGLQVDPSFATLASFDAIFFGTGSVTLGDGGKIAFNLTAPTAAAGLYVYIGEVSGDPGENIAGSLVVSSLPVPEPGMGALVLAGVAALAVRRRLGRPAQGGSPSAWS